MLQRWVQTTDHHFTVVDPSAKELPAKVRHCGFEELQEDPGVKGFDAIIVGIKPQLIDEVLPDYAAYLSPQAWVYSMAAGASCQRLAQRLQCDAVVRIMPNLPALIGQSMSGLFATSEVTQEQRNTAQELSKAIGQVLWVQDEDTIDKVTAVAGSGPGYLFEIMRSYVQAAQALGFDPAAARRLVLQTVLGSAQMALQSDLDLEELRNSVTSKNGTTQAGLERLRADQHLDTLLQACTQAAYTRAVELR